MPDSTVTIVGTCTRDPELRFTAGGRGVATLGIAVNHRYQRNNEWVEEASFFNVTAWSSLGENAAASLVKGSRIIVTGRLQQRSYETESGEKRSVVEIIADEIGPSLRWATATVEKTDRSKTDVTKTTRKREEKERADNSQYTDEEPFLDCIVRNMDVRNMQLTEPWM